MLLAGLVLTATVAPVYSNAGIGWDIFKCMTCVSVGMLGWTWFFAKTVGSVDCIRNSFKKVRKSLSKGDTFNADEKCDEVVNWGKNSVFSGIMTVAFFKLFQLGLSK